MSNRKSNLSNSNNPVITFEKGTDDWNKIGLCLIEMAKPVMKSKFVNLPTFQREIYDIWRKWFRVPSCRKMTFEEFTIIWSSYRKSFSKKGDFSYGPIESGITHHVLTLDVSLYKRDDGNTGLFLSTEGVTEEFLKNACIDLYSVLKRIEDFANTELGLYSKEKGYEFDNDELPF